jgi:chromosome partitioning protein
MRILSVANQKGGVGKTTIAVNLASALAGSGHTVLLIDNDPQGHATLALGLEPNQFALSTRDLYLQEGLKVEDARITVGNELFLVPADIDLSTVEQDLSNAPRKLRRLVGCLAVSHMPYDFVIIDNPPQVGLLTFNALLASSEVVLPVDAGRFSVDAVQRFSATLRGLQAERGHAPRLRIVASAFDLRTRHARRILEDLRALQPGCLAQTVIRSTVRLREAAQAGSPIDRFDRGSRAAADFAALASELLSSEWTVDGQELVEWEELLHGPFVKAAGVLFHGYFPAAERVSVTGDFNDWSVEGMELERRGEGHWEAQLPIAPGCYEYKFIVDGVWTADPENPEQVRNTFGQVNSVLVVPSGEAR